MSEKNSAQEPIPGHFQHKQYNTIKTRFPQPTSSSEFELMIQYKTTQVGCDVVEVTQQFVK